MCDAAGEEGGGAAALPGQEGEAEVTRNDLRIIARALDCYVNEYDGAAPQREIDRAVELASEYWAKVKEAKDED
jgi:hypothetical protein